ncbi:MAG: hypothetical protein Q8Q94_03310 [bacterium]|nr:hypothetical protein [bacterium]
MQSKHQYGEVKKSPDKSTLEVRRVIEAWQKRSPYVVTKTVFITGGTIFASLAVWCAFTAYDAEQFVVYGMSSMILFMLRYALTHL